MEKMFLHLFNMSITAGYLVLAVMVLRLLLKKAPKWITGVLWAFVALRLIFPFSIESILSLIPSAETVPPDIVSSPLPQIHSGIPMLNSTVNPIISESLAPKPINSVNPMQVIVFVATVLWLLGVLAMATYAFFSFILLRKKVKERVKLDGNIYVCDNVPTPFILGVFRPKIYLPSNIKKEDETYVISHEKAHLKRCDQLWKPLGFLLLTIYWFNPLLWVGYVLLCRDIELACDERVLRECGSEIKKEYSTALVNCSLSKKALSACPLAFGEVGVKKRIKNVLSYKKPAFWVVAVSLVACILVAVFFLTNPESEEKTDTVGTSSVGGADMPLNIEITVGNYKAEKLVFDCGVFSYVMEADQAPVFTFDHDNNIYETYGDEKRLIGRLEKTELEKEELQKMFETAPIWYGELSLQELCEQNVSIYKTTYKQYDYESRYLFLQENGEMYIGYGLYQGDENDAEYIRWLFSLEKTDEDSIVAAVVNVTYFYHDNEGYDCASLSINTQTKYASFSMSVLSSYFPHGSYEEDGEYLIVTTADDFKNKYTFKKDGDDLVFIASKSTPVPSYKYSSEDAEPTVCVPDGAVFKRAMPIISGPVFDSIVCDINYDGELDTCRLSMGNTSGLFSLYLSVNSQEYKFDGQPQELKFVMKDGRLMMQGTINTPSGKGAAQVKLYDIKIEGDNIGLYHEGVLVGTFVKITQRNLMKNSNFFVKSPCNSILFML